MPSTLLPENRNNKLTAEFVSNETCQKSRPLEATYMGPEVHVLIAAPRLLRKPHASGIGTMPSVGNEICAGKHPFLTDDCLHLCLQLLSQRACAKQ